MHKANIETLRDEAQRQLHLLKELLTKAQQKGLIDAPAKNERDRATFDAESLRKTLEVLDGECHKLNNLDMVLAVVGTMKAGKSTSINAIVGAEVLPNRNRPMTALPTLIRHTPGVLLPRLVFEKVKPLNDLLAALPQALANAKPEILQDLESDKDMAELLAQIERQAPFTSQHEGEQAIFHFLKGLNDLVRLCLCLKPDEKFPFSGVEFPFSEYATVDSMPVIEVEFSHLKNSPATQGRLTLLDTPGPNEAGQQHLRHMLKDQLKKASAVLAVLDYTQLKSDADAQVRENLLEIAGTAKGRMYALVNKFDLKDRNGDDAATVKQRIAQTWMKGKITGDSVFPVSSTQGYLASRARNEIERYGELPLGEFWVEDFGNLACGMQWDDRLAADAVSMQKAADNLWKKSGFAAPLEQVIMQAHQNAALEALRSATSKLSDVAKNAEDFFKANVGVLKSNAEALQININNLQWDIENINQVEAGIEKTLIGAQEGMKKDIQAESDSVKEKITKHVDAYLKEGECLEHALSERKRQASENAAEETKRRNEANPLWHLGNAAKNLAWPNKQSNKSSDFEGLDIKKGIVTFDTMDDANNFRKKIEGSIRHLFEDAERDIQSCIDRGISQFNQEFNQQRTQALEKIQASVQKNLDGFDIEIRLPKPKPIGLDTSVAGILKNAVQEKTKQVTRHKRQSNLWGNFCSLLGTDDWGWESYQTNQDYYEVNLNLINNASQQGVKNLFGSANVALDGDVYPQLHGGVEDFFKVFRKKIEHIRGDLLEGIKKHRLDEGKKNDILNNSNQMIRETSSLVQDCTALDKCAEALRCQEGIPLHEVRYCHE